MFAEIFLANRVPMDDGFYSYERCQLQNLSLQFNRHWVVALSYTVFQDLTDVGVIIQRNVCGQKSTYVLGCVKRLRDGNEACLWFCDSVLCPSSALFSFPYMVLSGTSERHVLSGGEVLTVYINLDFEVYVKY